MAGARARHSLLLLAAALTGCATADDVNRMFAAQVPPTPEERGQIVDYVRNTYFDPYSIRDATVSNKLVVSAAGDSVICIRLNAKNRMGGYVGMKSRSLRFEDGKIAESTLDDKLCHNKRLGHQPFPELEAL